MSHLYKNKYRIASTRLRTWDYGWNAAYFVTICTRNRICHFGNVVDGIMQMSEIGKIAERCWLEIPDHFPFVKLGNHIVMPNHVHGIVIIDRQDDHHGGGTCGTIVETQYFASLQLSRLASPPSCRLASPESSRTSLESSPDIDDTPKNKFGPQSQNLASIIRGFKIGVTINARLVLTDFRWQSRYYDHIIRDAKAYKGISKYIANNPRKWRKDQFHQ